MLQVLPVVLEPLPAPFPRMTEDWSVQHLVPTLTAALEGKAPEHGCPVVRGLNAPGSIAQLLLRHLEQNGEIVLLWPQLVPLLLSVSQLLLQLVPLPLQYHHEPQQALLLVGTCGPQDVAGLDHASKTIALTTLFSESLKNIAIVDDAKLTLELANLLGNSVKVRREAGERIRRVGCAMRQRTTLGLPSKFMCWRFGYVSRSLLLCVNTDLVARSSRRGRSSATIATRHEPCLQRPGQCS